jgi:hypothetical protein
MKTFKSFCEAQTTDKMWIPGDPLTDKSGKPIVLYHGTDKRFSKFSIKKSTMGIIWLTNDKSKIEQGTAGASGKGRIISAHVSLKNPAGWKEYDQLLLVQLKSMGYDGAILDDKDGTFDVFVFEPSQIKIISNK